MLCHLAIRLLDMELKDYLELGGWVIAGIFAVIGMFSFTTKSRRVENDQLTTNLINNLTKTVETYKEENANLKTQMEKNASERDAQILKLQTDFSHLAGRNSLLEELFKGRDPKQEAAYSEIPKMSATVTATNESVGELADLIKTFINTVTPLIPKPAV